MESGRGVSLCSLKRSRPGDTGAREPVLSPPPADGLAGPRTSLGKSWKNHRRRPPRGSASGSPGARVPPRLSRRGTRGTPTPLPHRRPGAAAKTVTRANPVLPGARIQHEVPSRSTGPVESLFPQLQTSMAPGSAVASAAFLKHKGRIPDPFCTTWAAGPALLVLDGST